MESTAPHLYSTQSCPRSFCCQRQQFGRDAADRAAALWNLNGKKYFRCPKADTREHPLLVGYGLPATCPNWPFGRADDRYSSKVHCQVRLIVVRQTVRNRATVKTHLRNSMTLCRPRKSSLLASKMANCPLLFHRSSRIVYHVWHWQAQSLWPATRRNSN